MPDSPVCTGRSVDLLLFLRGRGFGRGPGSAQRAGAVLQMNPHEPLEQLQFGALRNEYVLGDGIKCFRLVDGLAVTEYDTIVDCVQGGEMLSRLRASHGVVVPVTFLDQCPWQAVGRGSQRGDPFGRFIDHRTHQLDLRIEHFVDPDEIPSDDVPMCVFQRQLKIVERVEPVLQDLCDFLPRRECESGHREPVAWSFLVGRNQPLPSLWPVNLISRQSHRIECVPVVQQDKQVIRWTPFSWQGACAAAAHVKSR